MNRSDAEAHLAGEDELAVRFLSGGRSTLASVNAWIDQNADSWRRDGARRCLGIRIASTDELIGMIEANLAAPGYPRCAVNISYGLYPHARGYGFATRAVKLVLDYLAQVSEATMAVIQAHPANPASARVALRAGFTPLGERQLADGGRLLIFGRPVYVGSRPP